MLDKGTSVLAKLKNKSKTTGKSLQLHLQLFCQEEFLRRLALSPYVDNLILKGGLFIYTLSNFESRATIDVDFLLRKLPTSIEAVRKIIEEIIEVKTGNDFILFSSTGYKEISLQRKYKGISFQLMAHIDRTKTPFNVDVGVGDIIIPQPEKRKIPVQLDGFDLPMISTYSLESTIAEKLDAIVQLLELTSRMKDFYDIYYLANTFDFDGRKLQEAIKQTLHNRDTEYDSTTFDRIISMSQNKEMQVKWKQFLQRLKLTEIPFDDVLKGIDVFLRPIWEAIVSKDEFVGKWKCASNKWNL